MPPEIVRESIKVSGPELVDKSNVVISDIDGVLSLTAKISVEKLKRMLQEKFGPTVDLNFEVSQIEEYGQTTKWALERGFGKSEAGLLEQELWDSVDTLSRAGPVDGATELLMWLRNERKKIVKAHTSRPPEAREITENFLKNLTGDDMPLSIRSSSDEDRHMFKAINATNEAARYGRVLALEDIPSHASNILQYADSNGQDVWVLLTPFAKLSVPMEVLSHPRLVCIERRSDSNQSIHRVLSYLKGEPI